MSDNAIEGLGRLMRRLSYYVAAPSAFETHATGRNGAHFGGGSGASEVKATGDGEDAPEQTWIIEMEQGH